MPSRLSMAVVPSEPEKSDNVVVIPAPGKVKNPAAVALGRLGGSKGGKRRAEKLSHDQMTAIAKKGAEARWGKRKIE